MDAHKVARGTPRGAAAESGQSASGHGGEMLLMVEEPADRFRSNETVLRTIDELQPGGTVNHYIPYRCGCAYTLLQGESAKSCLCSYLLLPSMLNPSLGMFNCYDLIYSTANLNAINPEKCGPSFNNF